MKRLAALIAIALACVQPVWADALADQVKAEAARLLVQVKTAEATAKTKPGLKPAPLSSELVGDLKRFGFTASRLSVEIDQRGGHTDLRCIFRGMAEETDVQLRASASAATGGEQAKALARLSHMLKDAMDIAPSVGVQMKTAAGSKPAAAQCPAVRNF